MRTFGKKIVLRKILGYLASCLVGITFLSLCYRFTVLTNIFPKSLIFAKTKTIPKDNGNDNFVVRIVKRVSPAVVRINSFSLGKVILQQSHDERFFEERKGRFLAGSGILISSDGVILTNAHLISHRTRIRVTLDDGKVFTAKILGSDPITDVAVVKIEAGNLPTVSFGSSKKLSPGDWSIAIGNPLGLDHTATLGIISALNRSGSQLRIFNERVRFIQTDVAINPGNFGGPLFNARGELIGINTAIDQQGQFISFAIPIETAQKIARQIIQTGHAEHPYIGIRMVALDAEILEQLKRYDVNYRKLGNVQGVLIIGLVKDSPASKSHIQIGDIIQKIDQKIVFSAIDVQDQVESKPIGSSFDIKLIHQGHIENHNVQTLLLIP